MIVKGIVSAIDTTKNTVDVILPEYDNIVITSVNKNNSRNINELNVNDFVLVVVFNSDFNDTLLMLPSAAVSNNGTGFFAFEVDDEGNLYVITNDDDKPPLFEYDETTGDLYYVIESK